MLSLVLHLWCKMWHKDMSGSMVELTKKMYNEMQFYVRSGNNKIIQTTGQEILFPIIHILMNFTFRNAPSLTACKTELVFSQCTSTTVGFLLPTTLTSRR